VTVTVMHGRNMTFTLYVSVKQSINQRDFGLTINQSMLLGKIKQSIQSGAISID
jgi:hypothetical protein